MTLTLRERITRRSIPFQTLAALASERGFTVFPGDVSKWVTAPESVHAKKAERLASVFRQIEEMLDGVKVRPDLRDANVVRTGPAMGQWDGWFPRGAPSLIGGPSGGGKSTIIMAMLMAQLAKEVFLGHETFGLPYLILMADRGIDAFERTARRMNFNKADFPIKFIPAVLGESAIQAILNRIEECDEIPAVVFVEGLDGLVEDPNKMPIVTPFIDGLRQIAEHYHIALIGSVGAPKMRIGDGYTAKRDNIFGSGQWSRKSETIATMQYIEGDDTIPRRQLSVLPRNAPAEKFFLKMEGGKLVKDLEPIEEKGKVVKSSKFVTWFRVQPEWFTITDVVDALNVSQATAARQVDAAWTKDILKTKKIAKGQKARLYHWNEAANNPELADAESIPKPDAQSDETSL